MSIYIQKGIDDNIVILNLYSTAHRRDHSVVLPVWRPREKEILTARVKQREEGRAFQMDSQMVTKDLVWATVVLTCRTKRTCQSIERSGRCEFADKGERMWSPRYFGATPSLDLITRATILNSIRAESGSQCNWLNMKEEMWENLARRAISLASAFRTDWMGP